MTWLRRPLRLHSRKIAEDFERIHEDQHIDSVSLPYPISLDRTNAETLMTILLFRTPAKELTFLCPMEEDDGTPEVFSSYLAQTTALERLDVCGGFRNSATETTLMSLSQGLSLNQSITTLYLAKFNFAYSRSAEHFQQLLLGKPDFERLHFAFCDFGGNISCLTHGLSVQQALRSLHISCTINDEETAAVIHSITKHQVVDLCLSNCTMESKSSIALNTLLQKSTTLTALTLPASFFSIVRRAKDFGRTLETSNLSLRRLSDSSGREEYLNTYTLFKKSLERNRRLEEIRQVTSSKTVILSPSIVGQLFAACAKHNDPSIYFYILQKNSGDVVGSPVATTMNKHYRKRTRNANDPEI